jgi:hypothetical protein
MRKALAILAVVFSAVSLRAGQQCQTPKQTTSSSPMASQETPTIAPERLTFYEVGLVCPAAPKIGCGSEAKPVLILLGRDAHVAGAWLNEAGTRLAIGWKQERLSTEEVDALLDDTGIAVHEITGNARAELVASFQSNRGWYDSASVDRLSEREAGIIAARMMRRISAKLTLAPEQAEHLRSAFEQAIRDDFTKASSPDMDAELVRVAKQYVDGPALVAVRDVVTRTIALGYRPLPNEE